MTETTRDSLIFAALTGAITFMILSGVSYINKAERLRGDCAALERVNSNRLVIHPGSGK